MDRFSKKTIGDQITSRVIPGLAFPVAAIFDEKVKMEEVFAKWLLEKK